jgi:hypothetical protein
MQTNCWKFPVVIVVCLAGFALVSGCRKSKQESAEHGPQKFTQEQADLEFQKQLKMPGMRSTTEAGQFLAQLLESHRLPGAENFERGAMLGPASVYTPQSTNYPMSREFVGQRKLSGPWENHYIVVKKSADSSWQLQKAWRTDVQSNIVEVYPLQ